MNKYRTHNCAELSEKEIRLLQFLVLVQKKRPWKFIIYRFA